MHRNTEESIDWPQRHASPVRRLLAGLERVSLAVERPVSRWIGRAEFNPLYHTGTITNFLLLLILFTGLYLTFFYQFGFDASYKAIAGIEVNLVGRLMRAVHKYASGAALLTSLLHGWRMLFMDRIRGPRWLAWVTGVGLTALVWVAGVSGYWMIWDGRAALLNHTLIRMIENTRLGAAFLIRFLVGEAAGTGWIFMVIVITLHLGISALIGLSLWYHLKRLSRPKWLPPVHWMWILAGMLVAAGLLVPLGLQPQADPNLLPAALPVDLWFMAYLPAALSPAALLFWGSSLAVIAVVSVFPWLLRRRPLEPVRVDPGRCTGCTLCEADCPYTAIRMAERTDESRHKFLAVIDPGLCVSCGICIGSCPPLALSLGDNPPEPLWDETVRKAEAAAASNRPLVFACERHALQGARGMLETDEAEIIPLTCVGMAHPDLAAWARRAGAPEVRFVGCPPEDCTNREGNLWLAERLAGDRKPKLRREFRDGRVTGYWLAPDDFRKALEPSEDRPAPATTYGLPAAAFSFRAFFPGLLLFTLVLAGQIWLSSRPYIPAAGEAARVELAFRHAAGSQVGGEVPVDGGDGVEPGLRVRLEVDGQPVYDREYAPASVYDVFARIELPVGDHDLRVVLREAEQTFVLFAGPVQLAPGEIFQIDLVDVHAGGDPKAGEALYFETSLGNNASCRICHSLQEGVVLVGPSFAGVASRAETRVPGLSAADYLRQSILEPNAYVVDGFPAGQMPPNFGEILTEQQISDIIAFLLTLK